MKVFEEHVNRDLKKKIIFYSVLFIIQCVSVYCIDLDDIFKIIGFIFPLNIMVLIFFVVFCETFQGKNMNQITVYLEDHEKFIDVIKETNCPHYKFVDKYLNGFACFNVFDIDDKLKVSSLYIMMKMNRLIIKTENSNDRKEMLSFLKNPNNYKLTLIENDKVRLERSMNNIIKNGFVKLFNGTGFLAISIVITRFLSSIDFKEIITRISTCSLLKQVVNQEIGAIVFIISYIIFFLGICVSLFFALYDEYFYHNQLIQWGIFNNYKTEIKSLIQYKNKFIKAFNLKKQYGITTDYYFKGYTECKGICCIKLLHHETNNPFKVVFKFNNGRLFITCKTKENLDYISNIIKSKKFEKVKLAEKEKKEKKKNKPKKPKKSKIKDNVRSHADAQAECIKKSIGEEITENNNDNTLNSEKIINNNSTVVINKDISRNRKFLDHFEIVKRREIDVKFDSFQKFYYTGIFDIKVRLPNIDELVSLVMDIKKDRLYIQVKNEKYTPLLDYLFNNDKFDQIICC